MQENMIVYEAMRIKLEADLLEYPNSPDGKLFVIPLSTEFIYSGATLEDVSRVLRLTGIECKARHIDGQWEYVVFKKKYNIDRLVASTNVVGVLKKDGNYALLAKYHKNNEIKEFVVVWNIQIKGYRCDWMQGYYCSTLEEAVEIYLSKTLLIV